jgi:hypothetical protein
VDIPEIDTVLFYRKFDSFFKTIRTWIAFCWKDCLTVLDFVGNLRPEYDFESKFRALIGKTTR